MSLFVKIKNFLKAIWGIRNPKTWGPFESVYRQSKLDHDISASWSQAGEDLTLNFILKPESSRGIYIDVGAHHPDRFSVTRLLYQKGWRGINIDANSAMGKYFEERRSEDRFICGAVGMNTEYEFYVSTEPAVSTTNLEWKSKFESGGFTFEKPVQISGIKLSDVIKELGVAPDFLNIDIEGADFDALQSLELSDLDKELWPNWVMIETEPPIEVALNSPSTRFLIEFEYQPWLVLPTATIMKRSTES